MSSPTPIINRNHRMTKTIQEDNNNKSRVTERQQARSFITWYKHMIDNDRNNLGLYLSDDAILEWFGRTIKNRKKVTAFLKYDMQCSRHDFTTVESIEKVDLRSDRLQRKDDSVLASPLNSPELRPKKRKLFQSCSSPEWAEGCKPLEEAQQKENEVETKCNGRKRLHSEEDIGKGDGGLERKSKRKCIEDSTITPPNKEVGQGDCLPSTSGNDSDRSHDTLNAQLPKLAVECNGYIEFTRSRNSRSVDSVKWERKCKMQISYSEDPLNIGEYIIWMLRYTDETKCRRNLLAAFEEVAKEDKKI